MGIKVFPNYDTVWHFDDKVAQKYLLESIGAPIVPTTILYDKSEALRWTRKVVYPKVFKLRSGSGSKNVYLVRDRNAAERLVKIAFGKGFSVINMRYLLKERFRKYKIGKESRLGVLKGIARLFLGTTYLKMSPKEIGYLYMQDFIPGNRFDQRVIVIGEYAFAIKRMVRENDFRASGSGQIDYNKETIDLNCVKLAFETSEKLGTQCLSYDFIYDENMQPLIVEISFGFNKMGYYSCEGYWDKELNWHAGSIRPEEWMIANLLKHR
jgi:glutathione synthase/RimK-type ligase-like ATP-grasp enzyme